MFTANLRSYTIDLEEEEEDRWTHVIKAEKAVARRIVAEAKELVELEEDIGFVRKAGAWLFKKAYDLSGGLYVGEIESWADAIGISAGEATILNCSYELFGGCTTGARWLKGSGMVHVRNMDWPLETLGDATRLYHFVNGDHEFYSVGITGFVGVISGMVPGAYSVTINWAPPEGRPTFDFGPAFLLREVLETCETYGEAINALTHTKLSSPVFFMVCGTTKNQACVIERGRNSAAVRRIRNGILVQANHHIAKKFKDRNEYYEDCEEDEETDSWERADTLHEELTELGARATLYDAAECLDVDPVLNDNTGQQMAFCPATGEMAVWRRKCG